MTARRTDSTSFVISADGSKIAFETSGSGPLLVAVFGAICHRRFFAVRGDVKALAAKFTVIHYDRRGRGDSTENSPWSLEREIEDIAALIARHGGKAILYGHSSGAVLALDAALALREMVARVIVYDASYVSDVEDRTDFLGLKDRVERLLADRQRPKALGAFLTGIGMPKVFASILRFLPGWKTLQNMAHTILYDIALTQDLAPLERLRGMSPRTLLLCGEKSPESIKKVHRQLAQAIPNCSHHVIRSQDHLASMKALLPAIAAFMEDRT